MKYLDRSSHSQEFILFCWTSIRKQLLNKHFLLNARDDRDDLVDRRRNRLDHGDELSHLLGRIGRADPTAAPAYTSVVVAVVPLALLRAVPRSFAGRAQLGGDRPAPQADPVGTKEPLAQHVDVVLLPQADACRILVLKDVCQAAKEGILF